MKAHHESTPRGHMRCRRTAGTCAVATPRAQLRPPGCLPFGTTAGAPAFPGGHRAVGRGAGDPPASPLGDMEGQPSHYPAIPRARRTQASPLTQEQVFVAHTYARLKDFAGIPAKSREPMPFRTFRVWPQAALLPARLRCALCGRLQPCYCCGCQGGARGGRGEGGAWGDGCGAQGRAGRQGCAKGVVLEGAMQAGQPVREEQGGGQGLGEGGVWAPSKGACPCHTRHSC